MALRPHTRPWPPYTGLRKHTTGRTTFGRTYLEAWSSRGRDRYLTTRNIHNRQLCPPFEIRTRSHSKRAAEDARLRQRTHWHLRLKRIDKLYKKLLINGVFSNSHSYIYCLSPVIRNEWVWTYYLVYYFCTFSEYPANMDHKFNP